MRGSEPNGDGEKIGMGRKNKVEQSVRERCQRTGDQKKIRIPITHFQKIIIYIRLLDVGVRKFYPVIGLCFGFRGK